MRSISRRSFLKSSAGITASLLCPTWSQDLFAHLTPNKGSWELGVLPILYANSAKGYYSSLTINNPLGYAVPMEKMRPQNTFYSMHAFNPAGKLLWKKETVLETLRPQSISIPGDLGWCSVVSLIRSESSEISPNVEMSTFLNVRTPEGRDGHHFLRYPDIGMSGHIVPSPQKNEYVLIGLQNPMNRTLKGVVYFHGPAGNIVRKIAATWEPFQTHHILLGDIEIPPPENTWNIQTAEPALLILPHMEDSKMVVFNAWLGTKGRSFTVSHGIQGWPNAKGELPRADVHLAEISLSDLSRPTWLMEKDRYWYPADLACLHGSPIAKKPYRSILAVPNLARDATAILPIIIDEKGQMLAGPERKTLENWRERPGKSFIVQPNGFAFLPLNELPRSNESSANSYGTILCHVGQNQNIASLAKLWTYTDAGRLFVQHFRPQENRIFNEIRKNVLSVAQGWTTDYWCAPGDVSNNAVFFIRNSGRMDAHEAYVQYFSSKGCEKTMLLPTIIAGGYMIFRDASKPAGTISMRVISKNVYLTLAYIDTNESEILSMLHGQIRLRELALRNPLPQLL